MPENGNGWSRYEVAVLQKLEAHEQKLDSLDSRITANHEVTIRAISETREEFAREIATLQGKAAFAGGIGGLVLGALISYVVAVAARGG